MNEIGIAQYCRRRIYCNSIGDKYSSIGDGCISTGVPTGAYRISSKISGLSQKGTASNSSMECWE